MCETMSVVLVCLSVSVDFVCVVSLCECEFCVCGACVCVCVRCISECVGVCRVGVGVWVWRFGCVVVGVVCVFEEFWCVCVLVFL